MLNEKNFRGAFEPLHASDQTVKEVLKMTEKKEISRGGFTLRTAVAMTVIICVMATMTVAFAGGFEPGDRVIEYRPFQPGVFETEEDLLNTIFGLNGTYDLVEEYLFTHETDTPKTEQFPGWERGEMDPAVAAEVAPLVTYIGKSMEWNGYTFTADHLVYDKITGAGVLVYTMEFDREMPEFESYYPNGSFVNDYIAINGVVTPHMMAPEKTTEDLLVGYYTFFYVDPPEQIEITFSRNAEMGLSKQEWLAERQKIKEQCGGDLVAYESMATQWENSFPESDCSIVVDLDSPKEPECLTISTDDGEIVITPMGMSAYFAGVDEATNGSVVIRYADGTEYTVYNHPTWKPQVLFGHQQNFHKGCLNWKIGYAFLFNRLVDLDAISSVVLNGIEYFVE